FRQAHPEIPWRKLTDICNRLIYSYSDMDLKVIWTTITAEFPGVLQRPQRILEER
ncbi:MAG: DUF86 domain-containing protein, partial [Candidatus Hydrogenedentes bacterium]|nr:DUF86 domain-containing protein [Candidatus Hydrogenedentota bacterium]